MSASRRRLLVPAATTLFFFLLLLGLGVWQLFRLQWKEGILAQVARSEVAPPVPLTAHPPRYFRVVVKGRYLPGFSALYGVSTRDDATGLVLGADALAGLVREDGRPVLVNRGWVPASAHQKRGPPPPAGEVSVVGYVQDPVSGSPFTPNDDPAAGRVYALDPARIAREFHLPPLAGITVVAMGPARPGPVDATSTTPIPAQHLPRPPNHHLGYALTWFSLAIALAVIFWNFVRRTRES